MANYHVGFNPETNQIYAGTVNKKGDKWVNNSEVTEECLLAVRDHFLRIAEKEQIPEVGYRWEFSDGMDIALKIHINKPEEKSNESNGEN